MTYTASLTMHFEACDTQKTFMNSIALLFDFAVQIDHKQPTFGVARSRGFAVTISTQDLHTRFNPNIL